MTIGNAVFGVGDYTARYDTSGSSGTPPTGGSEVIGLVEGVKQFSRTSEGKDVRASLYGETVIDGIYRGGQQFVTMILKEWTNLEKGILWPWGGSGGASGVSDFGVVGPVGAMMSDWAGVLTLTAVPNTPAAGTDRNVITIHSAIIAAGHGFDIDLSADESNVPVVFRCFPVITGSPNVARWANFGS